MCCREDYFKFTNYLLPEEIFKNGRLFVYRLMRHEEMFIENLKRTWLDTELEEPERNSPFPNIMSETINFNIEHTGIILSIPDAKEDKEAVYIGIIFDKDDKFRYFTYEIGKGSEDETTYFVHELSVDGQHINYGCHTDRSKSVFINELAHILVYQLF